MTLLFVALTTTPVHAHDRCFGTHPVLEILNSISNNTISFENGKDQIIELLGLAYNKKKTASHISVDDIFDLIEQEDSSKTLLHSSMARQFYCISNNCKSFDQISKIVQIKEEYYHSMMGYLPKQDTNVSIDLQGLVDLYLDGGVETGKKCDNCMTFGSIFRHVRRGPGILVIRVKQFVKEKRTGVVIFPSTIIEWGNFNYRLVGVIYGNGTHFISRFILKDHCLHYDGMTSGGYTDLGTFEENPNFFEPVLGKEYSNVAHDTIMLSRCITDFEEFHEYFSDTTSETEYFNSIFPEDPDNCKESCNKIKNNEKIKVEEDEEQEDDEYDVAGWNKEAKQG
jgi:hypothetical protein